MSKCPKCNRYTLQENCPIDGTKTVSPHPPRFSPEKEAKFGKYRRAAKQ